MNGDREVREQHQGGSRDHGDRHEIGRYIERHRLVEPFGDNGARLHEQQRVAIWRHFRNEIGANEGARTRAVFHNDKLIEKDYDKDVYSGDIGYVDAVDTDTGELIASFGGRSVTGKKSERQSPAPTA
jgi:hypothetical protein